jgi:hypothetical protein
MTRFSRLGKGAWREGEKEEEGEGEIKRDS